MWPGRFLLLSWPQFPQLEEIESLPCILLSEVSGLRTGRHLRRSSKPISPILEVGKLKGREGEK